MKARIMLLVVALFVLATGATFAQTIWTGEMIEFSKANGADPTLEENQDRITDSVWITRGNNGGQIFNAVENSRSVKNNSPVGTRWAVGTTDDLDSLEFGPFRSVVRPRQSIGTDLVLHIIEEDIYIDIRITRWGQSRVGGFAYERSTPAE